MISPRFFFLKKWNRHCFDLRVSHSIFRLQASIEIQLRDSSLLVIHLQLESDGANPSLMISGARVLIVESPENCRSSGREQFLCWLQGKGQSCTGPLSQYSTVLGVAVRDGAWLSIRSSPELLSLWPSSAGRWRWSPGRGWGPSSWWASPWCQDAPWPRWWTPPASARLRGRQKDEDCV